MNTLPRMLWSLGLVWLVTTAFCAGAAAQQGPSLQLEYPGGQQVLDSFFQALRRVEAGQPVRVRVAQFGDSHTAGESWPAKFRERLTQRFLSGGRGFLFPGKPQKYHQTFGAKSGQSEGWDAGNVLYATSSKKKSLAGWGVFGPAGYSLCTRKPGADIWLELNEPVGATDAVVYFARLPEAGRLGIYWGNQGAATVETQGVAGEVGAYVVHFAEGDPRRILLRTESGAVCVLGMALETDSPGLVVDAFGVNGARLSTFGRLTPGLLQGMVNNRPYDLVVLAYGTNEASDGEFDAVGYEKSARKAMELLRLVMPTTACLMVGPPAFGAKVRGTIVPNGNVAALQPVLRKMATEYRCAYLDLYAAMGGAEAVSQWLTRGPQVVEGLQRLYDLKLDASLVEKARSGELPLLGKDLVHMHAAGYHLVAEIISAALIRAYETYLEQEGE